MISLFYILAGVYYGVTVPVQPMKVIGAYVIAAGMSPVEISASVLIMGGFAGAPGHYGAYSCISIGSHSLIRHKNLA